MKSFIAFFKKEILDGIRSSKFMILGILFCAFGIMNPAIAKLTPWLLEIMSNELAESGMTVTAVTVDAITSWTQFFKNIPMALIVFVFMYGSIFTKEYESGALVLILTKGLARFKIVLAKTFVMLATWTIGYFITFAITYAYNAYFWDNSIAKHLTSAVINWWLFGVFVISLIVLFSAISQNFSGVLVGTGAFVAIPYFLGIFPKIAKFMPTSLMSSASLLSGAEKPQEYLWAVCITCAASVTCVIVGILIFNKKQI